MENFELDENQQYIIESLYEFYESIYAHSNTNNYITVGGYAGTGKTRIIAEFKKYLNDKIKSTKTKGVAFVAPTGKAASVLKKKLDDADCFLISDFCGTIHKLMYYPVIDETTKIIKRWERKHDIGSYCLIVIDEASMVNQKLFYDLLSYKIPIIAVGDHGQLYPVSDKEDFSLMKNPTYFLTKIYRQEEGDPITQLSMLARSNGSIPHGCFSDKVFKLSPSNKITSHILTTTDLASHNIMMLTNSNRERTYMNEYVRLKNKYDSKILYPGEKLVCLTNSYTYGCMNGEIYELLWVTTYDKNLYKLVVKKENEDELVEILSMKESFGLESYTGLFEEMKQLYRYYYVNKKIFPDASKYGFVAFDFGYALSVHKAQGSSWEKVILFERRNKYQDDDSWNRWLYTGITRAEKSLLIVDGQYFTN